jgi:hypothetical protein
MSLSILFTLLLSIGNLAIHIGDSTWIDGSFKEGEISELKREHDDFVLFDRDGRRYLITDEGEIARIKRLVEPVHELGRKQGALGREQGKLGREQGKIGREQGRIGREQARAARDHDDDRGDSLEARQRELAAAQNELAEQQRELAERQRELARRAEELNRRVEKDLERVLDDAVKRGVAKRY